MPVRPFTIIGSANVDMIMKVNRLPERGETVTDGVFMQTFGGKGANQAVAAARAGGDVRFVACLGRDAFTPAMVENFRRDGLNLDGVRFVDDLPSGSALVMIDGVGMNYLTVAPGSNAALSPDQVADEWSRISSSGLILLQMEIPAETNREILKRAREAGIPVMLNYAPAHSIHPDLLAGLDTLIVNENEAAALSGIEPSDQATAERAVRALAAMGARCVILTLGAAGSLIFEAGQVIRVPAFPVKAVDTTAAGDTFCGALGVALLDGRPLPEAVRFATAAAALSVTRFGAQPSIPTRIETDHFIQLHP
ncbi:MAG: ribokinase [Opitutaceae bacterium]|jgi:ribokinase